jgi:hypothetical protein
MDQILLLPTKKQYYQKVLSTRRDKLIAYYPLWEASGTVVTDISGNGFNGSHTAVALGQPGIGDAKTAAAYNGSTTCTSIQSAGLAAAFNGVTGTVLLWAKVGNVGVWSDGIYRRLFQVTVDANNSLSILRNGAVDGRVYAEFKGSNVAKNSGLTLASPLNWLALVMTWGDPAGTVRFFVNNSAGTPGVGYGAWAGSPTAMVIGAQNTVPDYEWVGSLAHCAMWSVALSSAEITHLSRVA